MRQSGEARNVLQANFGNGLRLASEVDVHVLGVLDQEAEAVLEKNLRVLRMVWRVLWPIEPDNIIIAIK